MEEEVENGEESGEDNIDQNNLVLLFLLFPRIRAWEDDVDDYSEGETDKAGQGRNLQDEFFKVDLLIIIFWQSSIETVVLVGHYHLQDSAIVFYKVIDAEQGN